MDRLVIAWARSLLGLTAMRIAFAFAFAFALVVASSGCSLYFGDDTGSTPDATCYLDGGAPDAGLGMRNPETLQCEFTNWPGGCDPACGPCPLADNADQAPLPPWGACGSPCELLPEQDCLNSNECRAAYDYACFTGDGECSSLQPFLGCYSLSQFFNTGACEGLGSWDCSARADCVALHSLVCSGGACWQQFVSCVSEVPALPIGG